MCGIIGYIGPRNVVEVLLDGLERLEYRGYDSAGLAVVQDGRLEIRRVAGKIRRLQQVIRNDPVAGEFGVGHTRWATHGKPTEENAHPHRDCRGDIVVVHNGIIENYLELKERLAENGHGFQTETDTEVIAHLLEEHEDGDWERAVLDSVTELKGIYAFVALHRKRPRFLAGVRNGPPLVIGLGRDEYFLASDIPAVLEYTRDFIFLDNQEVAYVDPQGVRVVDFHGRPVVKSPQRVTWDPIMAQKGGFRHFMLKEIYEQPRAVRDTVLGRYSVERGRVELDFDPAFVQILRQAKRFFFIACGTSYHAALVGKHMLEGLARVPVEVDYASEFRYRRPVFEPGDLACFISQSGETADTLGALRLARGEHVPCLAVCNVVGSMMTRDADAVVYTHAGPEIGVASTKTFTTQLVVLYLLSLYLAGLRGTLAEEDLRRRLEELGQLAGALEQVLQMDEQLEALAKEYVDYTDFLYLGRGIHHPIALEGALKLKEISYIHAEGYAAGEMKHGPIALINSALPVVALAPSDHTYEKMLSNISEVKTRDGKVIAVAQVKDPALERLADHLFLTPHINPYLDAVINAVPMQLLAYHIAVRRGCDVDQPRNLAKSVTVE